MNTKNIQRKRTYGIIDENGEFQELDLGEIKAEKYDGAEECYAD